MKLSTSLVAVKRIICDTPRSIFDNDDIEKAAQTILSVGGLINPLVVARSGFQSYKVINGDFEYYAAVRAREIDLKLGEMVSVYIVEDDNNEVIVKQIELFRDKNNLPEMTGTTIISQETLNSFVKSIESRIDNLAHKLIEENKEKFQLEAELKDIKKKQLIDIKPLDIFNTFEKLQLVRKLMQTGMNEGEGQKITDAIVKERDMKLFDSLIDVVERVKIKQKNNKFKKGISSERMLKITDIWLRDD
ncbi:ParB N-terminal domain-containing protein [Calothrix sp. 336/3]|uniref:ParB N-terminal domain-containing protein n=1 Tax=Calothrix sp. 336/3 TaxID=1337936 RepID=UPI0004E2E7EE|nr:hypothetical protein [Calothrix sp. 336/3]AKG24081.1 hypothetical protein IJ00_24670 [Calothrix sp. 336/3]